MMKRHMHSQIRLKCREATARSIGERANAAKALHANGTTTRSTPIEDRAGVAAEQTDDVSVFQGTVAISERTVGHQADAEVTHRASAVGLEAEEVLMSDEMVGAPQNADTPVNAAIGIATMIDTDAAHLADAARLHEAAHQGAVLQDAHHRTGTARQDELHPRAQDHLLADQARNHRAQLTAINHRQGHTLTVFAKPS